MVGVLNVGRLPGALMVISDHWACGWHNFNKTVSFRHNPAAIVTTALEDTCSLLPFVYSVLATESYGQLERLLPEMHAIDLAATSVLGGCRVISDEN